MSRGKIAAVLALLVVIVGLSLLWHFSAYIYARELVTAIQADDLGKLSRVADVDALGNTLQESALANAPGALKSAASVIGQTDIGRKLAGLAKGIADRTFSSPRVIADVLRGDGILGKAGSANMPVRKRTMEVESRYAEESHDIFLVIFRARQSGEEAVVVLERNGIFVWRATAIRLSSPSLLLPFGVTAGPK